MSSSPKYFCATEGCQQATKSANSPAEILTVAQKLALRTGRPVFIYEQTMRVEVNDAVDLFNVTNLTKGKSK